MEEWRIIEGHEVSNLGNTKEETYKHGYYLEFYKSNHTAVHLIVAKAFPEICGEWFEGCQVHHKDRNKLNNRADNLICLTKEQHYLEHKEEKEELGHILFLGKHHTDETKEKMRACKLGKPLSEKHKQRLKEIARTAPVNEYTLDGTFVRRWDKVSDACAYYNDYHISQVCNGKRKSAAKRKWTYAN